MNEGRSVDETSTFSIRDLNKVYLEYKQNKQELKRNQIINKYPEGKEKHRDENRYPKQKEKKSNEALSTINTKRAKESKKANQLLKDMIGLENQPRHKHSGSFFTAISQTSQQQNTFNLLKENKDPKRIERQKTNSSFASASRSSQNFQKIKRIKSIRFSEDQKDIQKSMIFKTDMSTLQPIQEKGRQQPRTAALNSPVHQSTINIDTQAQLIKEYMKLKEQLKTLRKSQSKEPSVKEVNIGAERKRESVQSKDHSVHRERKNNERSKSTKSKLNHKGDQNKKKEVVELYINLVDNNEKAARKHSRSKGRHYKNKSFASETIDLKDKKPVKINLNLSSNFKSNNSNNGKYQQQQQVWPNAVSNFLQGYTTMLSPKQQQFPQVAPTAVGQSYIPYSYNQALIFYQQQAQLPRFSLNTVQSYDNLSLNGYMTQRSQQQFTQRTNDGTMIPSTLNQFIKDASQIQSNRQCIQEEDNDPYYNGNCPEIQKKPKKRHCKNRSHISCKTTNGTRASKTGVPPSILGSNVKDAQNQIASQEPDKVPKSENKNTLGQRRYSQVVAENILESPLERDFRDNKNYNIWGIKEMDIRDKPEHNFQGDDCQNCENCQKLQKELLRQQQYIYETQATLVTQPNQQPQGLKNKNLMKSANDVKVLQSDILTKKISSSTTTDETTKSQVKTNCCKTTIKEFKSDKPARQEILIMNKQVVQLDDDDDDDMETNAEDVANERESIKIKLNFNDYVNEKRENKGARNYLLTQKSTANIP